MQHDDDLPAVRVQYEELPYPMRRSGDEASRLIHTYCGNLFVINHFCFGGKKDFRSGFRCLVAGGGTGDAAIYLAEQLRHFDAEVVYLDFSTASREVAEARARVRGLTNITWVTASIMALPELGLGQFDFINCVGVLHHLESAEAGLAALAQVLKPDGGIYLMLYGKYGRRPVYDMQALMREFLPPGATIREKISEARKLLGMLPPGNSFQRDRGTWQDEISTDPGLYDLLLHSQDRCFTIREIHDLAESAGFEFLGFGGPHARLYDPIHLLNDQDLIDHVASLDVKTRQSVGELMNGNIIRHDFFLGWDKNSVASLDDHNHTLIAVGSMYKQAPKIAESMVDGRIINYEDDSHLELQIESDPVAKIVYTEMNGRTSLKKLYQRIRREIPAISDHSAKQQVRRIYDLLHSYGYLYLLADGSHGRTILDFDRLLAETIPDQPKSRIPDFLLNRSRST